MTTPAIAQAGTLAWQHRRSLLRLLLAAAAALLGLLLLLALIVSAVVGVLADQAPGGGTSISGRGGIPAAAVPYLALYNEAAAAFDVSPFLLMAVHEDETNYSSCETGGCPRHHGTENGSTAAGAMQFIRSTWPTYANAHQRATRPAEYPHRYEPHPDRWDDFDAIMAAGAYFQALGAGPQLDARTYQALLRYKGTPPASIPYAEHDYERALELQRAAQDAGSIDGIGTGPIDLGPIGPGGLAWPARGTVTSLFGQRWGTAHEGIDLAIPAGTPLHAAASGRVVERWPEPGGGYGNFLCLRHTVRLTTCYAHLSQFAVTDGQHVARGQLIGLSGCTGRCFGDHLHFEVRLGPDFTSPATDPMRYLP